jgi:nucleotide-binding universal stress UspA family protein
VQFRRILCAVDFSESALHATAYAINMAQEADAQLTLLHVVEIPLGADYEGGPKALRDLRASVAADARQKLHDLIPDQASTYCTVETEVIEGRAYQKILQQAQGGHADLIVMGVHGGGTVDMMLFGSTTYHVVRRAACPVLVVR